MPHKLLLADDSVTIQRVIELTFADEDIQVEVVSDGRQAIERVRRDRPDIVLADIGMPERDGYEVAAFIKGDPQLAHIPVVLLTGAFEPLDENRARSVGCDGVLVKPFEPQMVINRVKELLGGHRRSATWGVAATETSTRAHDFDAALAPPPAVLDTERHGDSLEDYFDRLDAAFSNIGAPPGAPPPPIVQQEDLSGGIRELHQPPPERSPVAQDPFTVWDPELTAGFSPARDPELTAGFSPARQPHLAHAFAALLAAEEGHYEPESLVAVAAPPPVSEDMIEDIVQRVIARMADDSVRRLVVETAERLVREEIDRIKRVGSMTGSGGQRSGG
jgi:CheY-like chemotaxis protein